MINCRKHGTERCPTPKYCPCLEAGESLVDLIFIVDRCPDKEPYEPSELMKVRADFMKQEEHNPALRADRFRRVRKAHVAKGMG